MKYIVQNNPNPFASFLIVAFAAFQGCNKETKDGSLSDVCIEYLNEALDIMDHNSMKRKVMKWNSFREGVLERAGNIQEPEQAYAAIQFALTSPNDHHSFLLTPEELASMGSGESDTLLPDSDAKAEYRVKKDFRKKSFIEIEESPLFTCLAVNNQTGWFFARINILAKTSRQTFCGKLKRCSDPSSSSRS